MKTENNNSFYKIIIYGDEKVGKTQIINVFCGIKFQEKYLPTFGVDFKIKNMRYNGSNVELQLIDTAGSGSFQIDLTKKFIKRTDAFIIVFDLSKLKTLKNIDCYIDKIQINKKGNSPNKIIYIVGNKSDLNTHHFIESEINEKIKEFDAKFLTVSAKKNHNINELFIRIISDIKNKKNFCYNFNDKVKYDILQKNDIEKTNIDNNDLSKTSTIAEFNKIENIKYDVENKENQEADRSSEVQNNIETRQKKCKCCPIY